MLKGIISAFSGKPGVTWYLLDCSAKTLIPTELDSTMSVPLGGESGWNFEGREEDGFLNRENVSGSINVNSTWYYEEASHKMLTGGEYTVVVPSRKEAIPLLICGETCPSWGMNSDTEIKFALQLKEGVSIGPFSQLSDVRRKLVPGQVEPDAKFWIIGSTVAFMVRDVWPEVIIKKSPGDENTDPENQGTGTNLPKISGQFVCLYCRHSFDLGHTRYLSSHPDLATEPAFEPTVWNEEGTPLDKYGHPCHQKACPHCGEPLPDSFGHDSRYTIFSIVGQSGSGKSYYLATLFHVLPTRLDGFDLGVLGDDAAMNSHMVTLSHIPFNAGDPIERYILKTDESQATQMQVKIRGLGKTAYQVPRPFILELTKGRETLRRLVFYDNPGEHFTSVEKGERRTEQARVAASHLAHAAGIFVLYDPTLDEGFRSALNLPPKLKSAEGDHQRTMLDVLPERMNEQWQKEDKSDRPDDVPVALLVGKWDAWTTLEPELKRNYFDENGALDLDVVTENSDRLREMLNRFHTGVPAAMTAISGNVCYFPVSALGCAPIKVYHEILGGDVEAPSRRAEPWEVDAPFVWTMWKVQPKLVRVTSTGVAP